MSFNSYLIIDKLLWTAKLTCEIERVRCWRFANYLYVRTYRSIYAMMYPLVKETWPEHRWSLFGFAGPHVSLTEITLLWCSFSDIEQSYVVRLWQVSSSMCCGLIPFPYVYLDWDIFGRQSIIFRSGLLIRRIYNSLRLFQILKENSQNSKFSDFCS
jgi:hypothetical protein